MKHQKSLPMYESLEEEKELPIFHFDKSFSSGMETNFLSNQQVSPRLLTLSMSSKSVTKHRNNVKKRGGRHSKLTQDDSLSFTHTQGGFG